MLFIDSLPNSFKLSKQALVCPLEYLRPEAYTLTYRKLSQNRSNSYNLYTNICEYWVILKLYLMGYASAFGTRKIYQYLNTDFMDGIDPISYHKRGPDI